MAAAMKSIVEEVKDLTECPICTEMFCNPKMLPCFHTFCLKCIEQYCKDKQDGDTMPCPMCRKEFIVPTGGLSKMSGNFFVERLITVQSPSSSDVVNCDLCLNGKQCKVKASSFCLECQGNMCDPCSTIHTRTKISMSHQISTISDLSALEAIRDEIGRAFCEKHPTEEIKFFCRDCKIPFCSTCFIAKHNKHECCEIEEIVLEFKKDFRQHSDGVSKLLIKIKQVSDEVDEQLATFSVCVNTTEKSILERSEEIKRLVGMHTEALIAKLSSHKIQCLKSIQTTKEELQRNMIMCESYVSYCQKVIKEGDSVESFRIADELRTMAAELKEKLIPKCSSLPDIKFHPSGLDVTTNLHNIIGDIHVKLSLEFNPQGFAILNDKLFCVVPASSGIHVYNIEPFAHQRTITVTGMNDPYDLVAGENVLYVSAYGNQSVYRIQLPSETVSSWSVGGTSMKLSISKNGNVIVASFEPINILEYTSEGTFVREIRVDRIDENLIGLQHGIQLEGDKFLVCNGDSKDTSHCVCTIDNTGRVIKCYGRDSGSGMGQWNMPYHLTIGRNGSILVADFYNNRIVQLNSSLEYMKEFGGFKQPIRLHFNEGLGRLYVIELADRSVTVLDM